MISYWSASFPGNIVVMFMSIINSAIYSLVSSVFKVFMALSEVTLFSNGVIGEFQKRIYVILAIFMLFKFAFSLLTSIVNPDNLLDKEKGMGKVISRTVIALILLIMVPTMFEYALEWQQDIAKAVPKIIIGRATGSSALSESTVGEQLASTALKAFYQPNPDCETLGEDDGAFEEVLNETGSIIETASLAFKTCEGKSKTYLLEFNGFVSVFAGIFIIIYLIGYCVDIAVRVIKIGVLRILAPIPIISYIDPKSEKSGAFGNWVKECGSTYVELFIKIGVLYFVLFILGNIASEDTLFNNLPHDISTRLWLNLFLILGSFFFMGKAASFICNILGIKYEKGTSILSKTLGFAGGALFGASLGAAGSLISGGGLYGAASAALEGIASGALGGKPIDTFNKGRDISAQMKTGNPSEKHKGILTKGGEALKRRRAESLGFTTKSIDDAKITMYNAKDEVQDAAALRDRFNSGRMSKEDHAFLANLKTKKEYKDLSDEKVLDKYYNKTVSNAGKAEKYYNNAKAYAGVLGVQTSELLAEKFAGGLNTQEYAPVRDKLGIPPSIASSDTTSNFESTNQAPPVSSYVPSYASTNANQQSSSSSEHDRRFTESGILLNGTAEDFEVAKGMEKMRQDMQNK